MRVLIVGDGPEADSAATALEAFGVAVERRGDDAPPGGGAEEVAEIARDLRELKQALGQSGPDAVLVASDSAVALAAVIVATKAGTPVGRIGVPPAAHDEAANARLISQLADTELAPDPAVVVEWARDGYPAAR